MKYIRLASDLHIEGFPGKQADYFLSHDKRDAESVLCLAGDVSSHVGELYEFVTEVAPRFVRVLHVPGNHEYYGNDLNTWINDYLKFLKFDLNASTSSLGVATTFFDEVRFVYCTLWADLENYSPKSVRYVEQGLNDFRYIRVDGRRFTSLDMYVLYLRHHKVLRATLAQPFAGKTIVMTHHLPSYELVVDIYKDSLINGGFVGNCDDILYSRELSPDLWLFGHTHDPIDKVVGYTRCVCNPRGYAPEVKVRGKYPAVFIPLEDI